MNINDYEPLEFRPSIQKEYKFIDNSKQKKKEYYIFRDKPKSDTGIARNRFGYTENEWIRKDPKDKEFLLFYADENDNKVEYFFKKIIADVGQFLKDVMER